MSEVKISGERLNEERAFIKRYAEGLGGHKVEYPSDFSTPLESRPRKVAIIQVPIAEPPEVMDVDSSPAQDTISITVKSLKPALSFSVSASITDPISHLKDLVAKSSSSAPSAESQRLLLKGKALVDSKLIKEYPITEGSVITLMLKPTSSSAPTPPISTSATTSTDAPSTDSNTASTDKSSGHARRPSQINPPVLTITTETNNEPNPAVPMTEADIDIPPSGPAPQVSSAEFHRTISDPQFWQRIHALCVSEFTFEDDADSAWESFLVSMKGRLSAGEAAKIRDVVGVRGMGGGA